jgi:hypothetical protein
MIFYYTLEGSENKKRKKKINLKEGKGTLRLYEVFDSFGCWGDFSVSRRDPCSKEFQTQLK